MTAEVFDDDLHNYLKENEFECDLCGKPQDHEGYCSETCRRADYL